MFNKLILILLLLPVIFSCQYIKPTEPETLGRFNIEKDLLLTNFDLKTDIDDAHAAAATATMLADERFSGVRHHAVAGTYGTQGGLYVPANDLFEMAFGSNWSDAHTDFDKALKEVSTLAFSIVDNGGKIWVAEGGQSDFTAAVVREIEKRFPELDMKEAVHVVQHAHWNEEVTTQSDLSYLRDYTSYHNLPDGNGIGNGTPGFRNDAIIDWRSRITDPHLVAVWERAIEIGNKYNDKDGRYLNTSVMKGGLDFSDASETTWIFGFTELVDANDFFDEFATNKSK